jgi:hypothetical protein
LLERLILGGLCMFDKLPSIDTMTL